jgi:shikimate dehydrogenase
MTDRYAVIGNPVKHSKSPFIHSGFAKDAAQDLQYTAIESALDAFAQTAETFRKSGGRGLNITAPFKLDAYAYATELSERARHAGAANALKFEGDRIFADNFDGIGLVTDIERNLGVVIAGKRVLLLGAGGAARGALLPLLERKPAQLVIANRTLAKAAELIAPYQSEANVSAVSFEDLGKTAFDIVLNATSASQRAELPPINPAVFASGALAYELVYGKGLTPFLQLARNAGVQQVADGVGMLVEQAAEAFAWWRGVRPETRAMIASITVPLV